MQIKLKSGYRINETVTESLIIHALAHILYIDFIVNKEYNVTINFDVISDYLLHEYYVKLHSMTKSMNSMKIAFDAIFMLPTSLCLENGLSQFAVSDHQEANELAQININ